MKAAFRKCSRILILCLLCAFVPIFMLSYRLKHISYDTSKGFVEDLSIIKHRSESQTLSATEEGEVNGMKEPARMVYKDDESNSSFNSRSKPAQVMYKDNASNSFVHSSFHEDHEVRLAEYETDLQNKATKRDVAEDGEVQQQQDKLPASVLKEQPHLHSAQNYLVRRKSRVGLDKRIKEMQDQMLRAKLYLGFAQVTNTSHLVKELKVRIRDVERAMNHCTNSSGFPKSALNKMRAMNSTLSKASRFYPNCINMMKTLRALTINAEEQILTISTQKKFLTAVGGRTIPRGLHCLSMKLTTEYFALDPGERRLRYRHELEDPYLYHFAIFSNNVLACSVVVNSTISSAKEPERIVFHIVTDSLNFPAMSMWFLSNFPEKSTVHVQSLESLQWLSAKYNVSLLGGDHIDPRYSSELNHLRFYLPDVFPSLHKIVFLDHDVVVQRDLSGLFGINMRGKVNAAVQICDENDPSFHRMDKFVNFTDPAIAHTFNANECTWAFGVNVFDLREWRHKSLTGLYLKYLQLGQTRPLWESGSLPIGWITFYNNTIPLDKRWHLLGLGHDPGVRPEDIEKASVIHFDGVLKPWLDIAIKDYKHLWRQHVNYNHPYLKQCNVHD